MCLHKIEDLLLYFCIALSFPQKKSTAQAGVGVACAVWGCIKRESSVTRGDLRLLSSLQGRVRQSVVL